jgi:hypothetical protein
MTGRRWFWNDRRLHYDQMFSFCYRLFESLSDPLANPLGFHQTSAPMLCALARLGGLKSNTLLMALA